MTRSTDPKLNAALEQDAAMLEAQGQDPGPELEDFDFDDDGDDGLGCYECEDGWKHGCCDDLCRGSMDALDCDFAHPCRLCNPRGRIEF